MSNLSKTTTFILGALLGLLLGFGGFYYFLFGVPKAAIPPGNLIQAPDPNGNPAGTASISINQQFFDTVLTTIFRDMNAPAFPLGQNQTGSNEQATQIAFQDGGCDGKVVLLPSGSGVTTAVRLENGKISAPLAFRGSYSILGYCYQFTGWAQALMTLRFDETKQTVEGQIDIQTVNLDGVPAVASGIIARFVQTSLNQRVNPVEILRTKQIALSIPVAATDGTLSAKVKDVRADIKENSLNLYVSYDFAGTKGNKGNL
ncbi:hypothetical protein BH10ACI1_BH10ACI1_07260 [soil metagenome]